MRRASHFFLLLSALFLISCGMRAYQRTAKPVFLNPLLSPQEPEETGAATRFPPSSSSASGSSLACLSCHSDYEKNHHPVDFAPKNPSDFPFPLYNGQVKCLTCHIGDHMGSAYMLRGGPYLDRRGICFKCHHQDEYSDIYPHIMLQDNGKFREVNGKPVCLVCHAVTPDPRVDRTNDVVFRADVAFLCWRCHSLMARPTLNQHVLIKPSIQMLRYVEKNERKMGVTIPLVPRERITCSTCHNPHQKGVIIYAPSARGADAPDRLRLPEPDLCFACHPF